VTVQDVIDALNELSDEVKQYEIMLCYPDQTSQEGYIVETPDEDFLLVVDNFSKQVHL
jgi:hypothetical protein